MTPRFTDHELLIRAQAVMPWREKVAELETEIAKLREALEKIAARFDRSSHLLLDEELEIAEIARAALRVDG